MSKVRWGVLSTARIGQNHVIPAMQQGTYSEVTAIGSRDKQRAEAVAQRFGIPKAYGSYDQLLADPDVDAIYIPLPNDQHVLWSIKTLEAGKHVLCEKPIALTADEAQTLVDAAARYPQLKVMEAFMYRFQPQWQRAKQLVTDGAIGDLRTIQSFFAYSNLDPANIRNQAFLFAIYFRCGANAGVQHGRIRPALQDRPSGLGHARLRCWFGHVHLLNAALTLPASQYRWHDWPDRDRNSRECPGQTSLSDLVRARFDHG